MIHEWTELNRMAKLRCTEPEPTVHSTGSARSTSATHKPFQNPTNEDNMIEISFHQTDTSCCWLQSIKNHVFDFSCFFSFHHNPSIPLILSIYSLLPSIPETSIEISSEEKTFDGLCFCFCFFSSPNKGPSFRSQNINFRWHFSRMGQPDRLLRESDGGGRRKARQDLRVGRASSDSRRGCIRQSQRPHWDCSGTPFWFFCFHGFCGENWFYNTPLLLILLLMLEVRLVWIRRNDELGNSQ